MEMHPEYRDPATPILSYDNSKFWKNEDSGYHTSLTPGSAEFSEISGDNLDPSFHREIRITGQIVNITPDVSLVVSGKCGLRGGYSNVRTENCTSSPIIRRGTKRSYQEDSDISVNSSPTTSATPTTFIASRIQKLHVNDSRNSVSSVISDRKSIASDYSLLQDYSQISFPSTPIKRICKTSCNLSPSSLKRTPKKLNFAIHSLSCSWNQELQPKSNLELPKRTTLFRPDQKIDIIRMLYQDARVTPPISKILSYLSNKDIFNFTLVSDLWCEVWDDLGKSQKQSYTKHLEFVIDNRENKDKGTHNKNESAVDHSRSLKEVQNFMNATVKPTADSPPGTPRTIKFRRFAKAASVDDRVQLPCVRCQNPAKVTEEPSGEEWVKCLVCSYQFCKFCNCMRHPGKICFQYDLQGPSPSKRKKTLYTVGSKKSKKNLRRLL